MKIIDIKQQVSTLKKQVLFDPFKIHLSFEDITRREVQWLLPLWRDLDADFQLQSNGYVVNFNIYQFHALYQVFKIDRPKDAVTETLKQIWQDHQLWWRGKRFAFNLTLEPMIYDIINLSPDSFYDGGALKNKTDVLKRVEQDLKDGADVIEVGGQTTRPNFTEITPEVEIQRDIPVIQAIKAAFPEAIIAVDTYKTPVMQAVLDAGVDIINDVNGFRDDPKKLALITQYQAGVLTMHENRDTVYQDDLTSNIRQFFKDNLELLLDAGIDFESIALDQGIGYSAKADSHENFALMRTLDQLNLFHRPIMVAVSNKGFYGKLLGLSKDERLLPTIISEAIMQQQGGRILRVHDVKATADMVKLLSAINNSFLIDKENTDVENQ